MGRLCRGPCYLRGRKKRALNSMKNLGQAMENLEKEKRGEKPKIGCWVRIKLTAAACLRSVFPQCFRQPQESLTLSHGDASVESDGIIGRFIRLTILFFTGQLIGLLFWLLISFKLAENPELIGIVVGSGTQLVTISMIAFAPVRCVGLLCLPELLTRRGRAILLLMATIWVLQGPAANINTNQILIGKSLACVSDRMKNQTLEIKELVKNALADRLEPFKDTLRKVKSLLKGLEDVLGKITKALNRMLSTIKESFDWLRDRVKDCKKASLSPYFKCMHVIENFNNVCESGPLRFWFWLIGKSCNADPFLDICECAKGLQIFCRFPAQVKKLLEEHVLQKIKGALERAVDVVSRAFKFDVSMGREGNYSIIVKSNMSQLYDMIEETARKFKKAMVILAEILNWVLLILLFLTLLKAILYRRSFLKRDYSDNYFITDAVKDLDRDRDLANKETILPILPEEKRNYIPPITFRLTSSELRKVIMGFVHTFIGTLFALLYMALDYMTYEFTHTIYVYFGEDTAVDVPNFYDVSVRGEGSVARSYGKMMRSLVPAFNQTTETNSWRRCIHTPSSPDYQLYKLVAYFLAASYIMVPLQVYAMRCRQFICGQFYPHRKKIRALYLYNIILKSRGGFIGLMKQGFLGDGFGEALAARQPVMGHILRVVGAEKVHCVLCLRAGKKTDTDNFRMCHNRECTAAYCIECYGRLKVCRMCQLQLLTEADIVLEEAKDSSDEETENSVHTNGVVVL